MKLVALSFLALIAAPSAFAVPCPDLSGKFEAKVGPLLNQLEIKQSACDSFELTLTNSSGTVLKRVYHTDSVERPMLHSGRKVESASARMEAIQVGEQTVFTLRIDSVETDNYLETSVKERTHFYIEGNEKFRALVERKDVYDSEGNRLGRVYIGYRSIP